MEMATRQPKKKFNLVGFLIKTVLPLAAIAAFVGALNFGPSKRLILEGPLKPYLAIAGSYWDQFSKPLHFIAQQQVITEKNREIQALNSQIDKDRKDLSSRDDKIKTLQNQVNGAKAAAANATPEAASSAAPGAVAANQGAAAAAAGAAAGAAPAAAAAPGASAAPSADDAAIKRTADVWAQMDADAVAGLVQKLPMDYVIRVLGQMSADQVAEVLGALPPKVAAQLTIARVSK
jgi:flagellar motility protein MotE (MotC chaperone)